MVQWCAGWWGTASITQHLRRNGDLRAGVLLDLLQVAALLAYQPPHQAVMC